MKTMLRPLFLSLSLAAGLTGSVDAAVTFSVTPSAVSNTYNGPVTLQVAGITSGDTVVVQKFLDLNSNGVVDASDLLVQQFNLTDGQAGMVIGGVTNLNVPGDGDTTSGQITAAVNFQNGDFPQTFVGNYLYIVSSPLGHFSPITNSFTVTNFPFAQTISGTVLSNGVPIPNAVVLLFPAPRGGNHGPGNPLAGTVANNSGAFSIQAPPGIYVPVSFKSGCVASYPASPVLTLASSQTINTNLSVINATTVISGQIVDAGNTNIVLPGVLLPISDDSGSIAIGFTDTNGAFSIGVISGTWNFGDDDTGLIVHGYVGYMNGTNAPAGTTGIIGPYSKGTAMFYGRVRDNVGNPLAKIDIQDSDNNSDIYQMDGYSDTNGNYFTVAIGGLGNSDPWQLNVSSESPTNYIYSMPDFDLNGSGTNLAVGQALHVNFTALPVTGRITGNVQSSGTNLANLGVFATATIGGLVYNVNADTDANGNYSLNVANGVWSVGVDCNGGNNSLDSILGMGNYQCPNNQTVTNSGTANFTVLLNNGSGQIFGYVRNTGSQPLSNATVYVNNGVGSDFSTNTDSNGYYSLIVAAGTWGVSLDCGQLNSLGYQCVSTNFISISGNSIQQNFTVQSTNLPPPLQINTFTLPAGTNGIVYSQTFQASGGTPPYNWVIPNYSVPPPGLGLANNGVLSGTPTTDGKFYFDVVVTDSASNTLEEDGLTLTILNNPPLPPLAITSTFLPGGTVGAPYNLQLGATGGQPPYGWSLAVGSANPPPGLTLSSSGLISGTPTIAGTYYFQVQAADAYSTTTTKVLSIGVAGAAAKPTISSTRFAGNQFQMLLNGLANQNYTLQMSTNLSASNWNSLYITNNPTTNSFLVADPNATNKQRFYRILVGP